uniref:Major facilitator superfamily (MFS) profile domain-containing protein n=1 Tax=Hucho hucho TaxID=62062 RepID=A0A4W5KWG1_9TELE
MMINIWNGRHQRDEDTFVLRDTYERLSKERNGANTSELYCTERAQSLTHQPLKGPVSSILVNRYGCRPVVIIGGLMVGASMVAASFGTTIIHLYLLVGVIGGIYLNVFL